MKDAYDKMKQRARAEEMRDAESVKQAFIQTIKSGLGKQLEEELTQIKPPTRWQVFIKRCKKILSI